MILWSRVANLTKRPYNAPRGMTNLPTSSKLKRYLFDEDPRFWGDSHSGRPSFLDSAGEDNAETGMVCSSSGPCALGVVGEVVKRLFAAVGVAVARD